MLVCQTISEYDCVGLDCAMAESRELIDRRLRMISDCLDIPVEQFYGDTPADQMLDAGECLRLWYSLRTDAGRAAALDALRKIRVEEGP